VKILRAFNIWANSNRVPSKAGKLDRYLLSRMLQLETLERRITPATYTVVNNLDSGTGSLRQAILDANANAGNDQIIFNLTGTSPYTITLGSALPTIVSASTAIVTGGTAGTVTITGLGASSLTISGSDPTNANNATRNFSIFSIASGGDLSISGVTISGAQTSSQGGAFNNSGTLNIANSTISGNTAGTGGGGIFNSGTLNIANSIINSTSEGDYAGTGTIILIGSSTNANNLVTQSGLSWATTVTSAQLNLGPLQNNGGPTFTMALGAGSAAIGAGNATISNAAPILGKDQCGYTRSSTTPSIGAFEYNEIGPAPTITSISPTTGSTAGGIAITI